MSQRDQMDQLDQLNRGDREDQGGLVVLVDQRVLAEVADSRWMVRIRMILGLRLCRAILSTKANTGETHSTGLEARPVWLRSGWQCWGSIWPILRLTRTRLEPKSGS